MTLTLMPETEARLRAVADRQGVSADSALNGLLETILREEEAVLGEDAETQAAVAEALRRSVEDFDAGRWVSLEDFAAGADARRRARGGQP